MPSNWRTRSRRQTSTRQDDSGAGGRWARRAGSRPMRPAGCSVSTRERAHPCPCSKTGMSTDDSATAGIRTIPPARRHGHPGPTSRPQPVRHPVTDHSAGRSRTTLLRSESINPADKTRPTSPRPPGKTRCHGLCRCTDSKPSPWSGLSAPPRSSPRPRSPGYADSRRSLGDFSDASSYGCRRAAPALPDTTATTARACAAPSQGRPRSPSLRRSERQSGAKAVDRESSRARPWLS